MGKDIKQYRNLFENWQRHVQEEETVSQEPQRVIEIPAPPPIQNPQMDDEEMDRIMAEAVEGRKIVKEQPLSEKKKKKKKETDPNIPKDAVLGYVCEEVLEKVIVAEPDELQQPDKKIEADYREAVAKEFKSPQIKNTITGVNKDKTYKNTIEYVNNLIVFHNKAIKPTQDAMGYRIDVCPTGSLRRKGLTASLDQYETTIRNLVGNTLSSSAGGGSATYDVETDRANLHVKLNQDKAGQRLIGFQRGLDNFKSELPELRQNSGTLMNRAWSNFLKRYFVKGKGGYEAIVESINEEMNNNQKFNTAAGVKPVTDAEKDFIKQIIIANTITAEGVISKPSGYGSKKKDLTYVLSGDKKGTRIGKRRPEQEGETLITMPYGSAEGWWAFVKNRYKELIKEYMNSDPRFNKSKYKLLKYVLGDIKTKLIGQPGLEGDDKVTLFFNYSGGMKKDEEGYKADVELDVNKYRLKGCGADAKDAEISLHFLGLGDPETDKKQPFGLVYSKPPKGEPTDDKGENILFTIEFRTDGEGHPPQLKIGKGLKVAKQDNSDLHKWYRKAANPEEAG